jgi:hypothetical protein
LLSAPRAARKGWDRRYTNPQIYFYLFENKEKMERKRTEQNRTEKNRKEQKIRRNKRN